MEFFIQKLAQGLHLVIFFLITVLIFILLILNLL